MRLNLKPLVKDFELDYRSDIDPDARATVSIRQASTGEQLRIAGLFSEQTQIWDDAEIGTVQLKRKWNPHELHRFRAYLTMAGCDIEDDDGDPLFKFRNTKSGAELAMSQAQFNAAWDALPPELTQEIHQKVLEVNPQWDFSRQGE